MFPFSRAFEVATGLAQIHYVAAIRIGRAKETLATSEATVDEVASATRFSSGANLGRAFKRSVGPSPDQYRLQSVR